MSSPHPHEWLSVAGAASPQAPALVIEGRTVSYGELARLAARATPSGAASMPDGAIAVVATPRLDVIAGMWGAWAHGTAVLPLDPRDPGGAELAGKYGVGPVVEGFEFGGRDAPSTPPLEMPHSLVRTSGSGGSPRVVVLSHGNVAAAVGASRHRLGTSARTRWLLTIPLFHVGGLSILWRMAEAGGTAVIHSRFDPRSVSASLRSGEAGVVSLVPSMLRRMLDASSGSFPNAIVLLGGAAAPSALIEAGIDRGLRVLATYGMTETTSQVATVAPGEERAAAGTVGSPLEGVEITIAGEHGAPVAPGATGEILVDGPVVSPGYLGSPPRVGPLHTGDLGFMDRDGRLTVVGRADDRIITGGENVDPNEVEAAVALHPGVSAVAVCGVPDPDWGQIVAAWVVPSDRALSGGDLTAFVRNRLAPHQIPRRWDFVDALPLLPNGKVDRAALP